MEVTEQLLSETVGRFPLREIAQTQHITEGLKTIHRCAILHRILKHEDRHPHGCLVFDKNDLQHNIRLCLRDIHDVKLHDMRVPMNECQNLLAFFNNFFRSISVPYQQTTC